MQIRDVEFAMSSGSSIHTAAGAAYIHGLICFFRRRLDAVEQVTWALHGRQYNPLEWEKASADIIALPDTDTISIVCLAQATEFVVSQIYTGFLRGEVHDSEEHSGPYVSSMHIHKILNSISTEDIHEPNDITPTFLQLLRPYHTIKRFRGSR